MEAGREGGREGGGEGVPTCFELVVSELTDGHVGETLASASAAGLRRREGREEGGEKRVVRLDGK